jgi:hypothetical protein
VFEQGSNDTLTVMGQCMPRNMVDQTTGIWISKNYYEFSCYEKKALMMAISLATSALVFTTLI